MHRLQAPRREGLTNPAPRLIDVRVGSATDGRVPISFAERSLSARPFHWIALAAIAASAIVADQLTKQLVVGQLAYGESVHVAGPLDLHYVRNSGIAFGLFSTWASVVTILTVLAVAWMLSFFAKTGARHPVLPVALGLLVGGSAGNLIDRIRLGHVTDFLDLGFWPAFNLADTFIVTGVAILLATLLRAEREPRFRRARVPRTSG
jgi:signal peptidase II